MKVVNQLVFGVHIAVTAEALAFAESLGLDASQVYGVLSRGAAQSFMFEDRGGRMLDDPSTQEVRSALDIFVKDMGLVVSTGNQLRVPLPLAATANADCHTANPPPVQVNS